MVTVHFGDCEILNRDRLCDFVSACRWFERVVAAFLEPEGVFKAIDVWEVCHVMTSQ